MQNLEFKYLRAKNFICFGPDGIELDLSKGGQIIHVIGENLDQKGEESEKEGSNGAGKSSIPEILTYGLFGKTIKSHKKINHSDVIHNKVGKNMEVEVRWDQYRVIRTRKPTSLRLWESEDGKWTDETEITMGGMPATQKLIEDKLGITYETFINLVVFSDNDTNSFLEADGPEKREIVENLLSLNVYRDYFEMAKKKRKRIKDSVDVLNSEYEKLLDEKDSIKLRLEKAKAEAKSWKNNLIKEYNEIKEEVIKCMEKLKATDQGNALVEYHDSQERIQKLNLEVKEVEEKIVKLDEFVAQVRKREDQTSETKSELRNTLNKLTLERQSLVASINKNETTIEEFQKQKGQQCPACFGMVEEKNYQHVVNNCKAEIDKCDVKIASLDKEIDKTQQNLEIIATTLDQLDKGKKKADKNINEHNSNLQNLRREITELSKIKRPDSDAQQQVLESRIEELKKQGLAKKDKIAGPSPLDSIIEDTNQELKNKEAMCISKKKEVQKHEKLLPYYDYYKTAFGDTGIRKFIIDGIIPALNNRIAYWLQFLLNNKYTLEFDNEFNEIIQRNPPDGSPFVYHLLSRSQCRRMNLAVSQAFAHVMMLNSGRCPNIVFLDEVARSVDPTGVEGIYNMICELSKDKKVLITTHHRDLQEMLAGCETLRIQMKNGFSKVV